MDCQRMPEPKLSKIGFSATWEAFELARTIVRARGELVLRLTKTEGPIPEELTGVVLGGLLDWMKEFDSLDELLGAVPLLSKFDVFNPLPSEEREAQLRRGMEKGPGDMPGWLRKWLPVMVSWS